MPTDSTTKQPNRWVVLAVIAAALQIVVIDITVLNIAAPQISEDLRPSSVELLWIIDVFPLVVAPLLVLSATLGDRFGRKLVMLSGLTFFTFASLLAAYAWSPGALIGARVLQGIGGAMIMPPTMAIIRDVFPDRDERVRAIGIWSATMAAGAAAGPVIGGLVISRFWWGAVFLMNVPIALLVLPIAIRVIPESRSSDPPPWDPLSVALVAAGILLLIFGIKDGARNGFGRTVPLACLAVSVTLLWVFARRQLARAHPTLDLRLFKRPAFSVAVACVLLAMAAIVGLELFFAQYFQEVLGLSPAASGLRLGPFLLATLVGGLTSARFLTRFGTRRVIGYGLGATALGFVPTLAAGLDDHYLLFLPGLILAGFGNEIALVAANDVIFGSVSADNAGQASAIEETAYELGGGIGVAVLGSIVAAVYRGEFAAPAGTPGGAAGAAQDSISEAVLAAEHLPPAVAGQLLGVARHAFVSGMHAALIVSIALCGAAALAAAVILKDGRTGDGEPELAGARPG